MRGFAMDDDELHISRIPTAWSMVREAHGDHTAVPIAQQRCSTATAGPSAGTPCRRSATKTRPTKCSRSSRCKFVRGDFGNADPERGRFRAFVKTVVYRLIVDYQRRKKKRVREGPMHSNIAEPAGERCRGHRRRRHVSGQLARRAAGPLLAEAGRRRSSSPASRTTRCSAIASTIPICARPSWPPG